MTGDRSIDETHIGASLVVKWNPHSFGRYKLNWDVALDSSHKVMGIGVVVRDYNSAVIVAQGRRVMGLPESVHVEAMGAVVAAEFSRDLGLPDAIMEGDSLIVTKALKNVGPNWSP